MKLACTLLAIVSLLHTFAAVICEKQPSDVSRYRIAEEDDVPRVQIKVFRGANEERDGESFATWGYWIKQPTR